MKRKGQRPDDLHAFMVAAGREMQSEYERIQRTSKDDPGTAGDQGEENWKSLLSDWLPPYYQVVTKGRILSEKGEASPQVDVLVLHPTYPRKLKDVKQYLAAGVVAAFECKLTLNSGDIGEAIECGKKIRRLLPNRRGTPYKELNSPLFFGLLAHSHSWKSPGSHPRENISNSLFEKDGAIIEQPIEMLDFLCVADLGTWIAQKTRIWDSLELPKSQPDSEAAKMLNQVLHAFGEGCTITCYLQQRDEDLNYDIEYTPIGSFLTCLFRKLAWEDPALRPLAKYFETSRMGPGGGDAATRTWPIDIYSKDVRGQLNQWRPPNVGWDEWASLHM